MQSSVVIFRIYIQLYLYCNKCNKLLIPEKLHEAQPLIYSSFKDMAIIIFSKISINYTLQK